MTPLREIVERIFNDFCLGEFTVEKEQRFKESVEAILEEVVEEAAKVCDASTKPSKELCNSEYHDDRWCSDCDRMTAMADVLGQEIRTLKEAK